jgi:hypothetical protein
VKRANNFVLGGEEGFGDDDKVGFLSFLGTRDLVSELLTREIGVVSKFSAAGDGGKN